MKQDGNERVDGKEEAALILQRQFRSFLSEKETHLTRDSDSDYEIHKIKTNIVHIPHGAMKASATPTSTSVRLVL